MRPEGVRRGLPAPTFTNLHQQMPCLTGTQVYHGPDDGTEPDAALSHLPRDRERQRDDRCAPSLSTGLLVSCRGTVLVPLVPQQPSAPFPAR